MTTGINTVTTIQCSTYCWQAVLVELLSEQGYSDLSAKLVSAVCCEWLLPLGTRSWYLLLHTIQASLINLVWDWQLNRVLCFDSDSFCVGHVLLGNRNWEIGLYIEIFCSSNWDLAEPNVGSCFFSCCLLGFLGLLPEMGSVSVSSLSYRHPCHCTLKLLLVWSTVWEEQKCFIKRQKLSLNGMCLWAVTVTSFSFRWVRDALSSGMARLWNLFLRTQLCYVEYSGHAA